MNLLVKISSMNDLITELRRAFDNEFVDVNYIQLLMNSYCSEQKDWKEYTKFDPFRYTRNLVDKGNGKYNLMILCWNKGQKSAIHDHSNSHCFMKILQGEMNEILYTYPRKDDNHLINEKSRRVLKRNDVCYINDTIGLHCIENASENQSAISLHLYCPPFDTCRIFNQDSGESTVCKLIFHSIFGRKNEFNFTSNY